MPIETSTNMNKDITNIPLLFFFPICFINSIIVGIIKHAIIPTTYSNISIYNVQVYKVSLYDTQYLFTLTLHATQT